MNFNAPPPTLNGKASHVNLSGYRAGVQNSRNVPHYSTLQTRYNDFKQSYTQSTLTNNLNTSVSLEKTSAKLGTENDSTICLTALERKRENVDTKNIGIKTDRASSAVPGNVSENTSVLGNNLSAKKNSTGSAGNVNSSTSTYGLFNVDNLKFNAAPTVASTSSVA